MKHAEAWELIPWLVNETLGEEERADIAEHLQHCADCRAEVELQKNVMAGMRTRQQVESMPHAAFQKLCGRIDGDAPAIQPQPAPRQAGRRMAAVQWLAAAVVAQTLLLGVLAVAMLGNKDAAPAGAATFSTVSETAAAAVPGVRAVFAPGMTVGELQALLQQTQLHIAAGPTSEGIYTLALAKTGDRDRALLALRAHPATRFAEPIGP